VSRRRKFSRRSRRRRRRGVALLPNLITTASLCAGFGAVLEAFGHRMEVAALAILLGLVLDGLDGRVARATGTVSAFGVEYDSLSDLVTFGVAPAVVGYLWALEPLGRLGFIVAFMFVACGAMRLARFNVQLGEVGTSHFVGLPIPAAASTIALGVLVSREFGWAVNPWVWAGGMMFLSCLMVSTIPYLSLKEMALGRLKSFNGLVLAVLILLLIAIHPQVMGFGLMALYVLGGPLGARLAARSRARRSQPQPQETTVQ